MMAYVYALQEQYRVAEEQLAIHLSEANTPFMRAQGLLLRAHLQVWRGRFSDAQTPLRECVAIADSTDNGVLRAEAEWLRLWSALLAPENPSTIELPDLWRDPAGLERVVNPWYPYYRGRSELRSGRPDSLEFYARQMEASEGSVIQRDRGFARCLATVLRRERLLAVDSAHAALALSPITPRVATLVPHINCLVEPGLDGPRTSVLFSFSGDMEARTYLAVGDTERAILEYERAMRQDPHRRLWIPPLYHYRLAALYDQMGASQRAIEEYEAFLSVWDRPDSAAAQPLLARKRLALLQGSAPRHLP
jgi:tetratricopeptide (TPR) repeat protein